MKILEKLGLAEKIIFEGRYITIGLVIRGSIEFYWETIRKLKEMIKEGKIITYSFTVKPKGEEIEARGYIVKTWEKNND